MNFKGYPLLKEIIFANNLLIILYNFLEFVFYIKKSSLCLISSWLAYLSIPFYTYFELLLLQEITWQGKGSSDVSGSQDTT